ncbi:hypothetical protein PBOI14_30190 [Pseudomonas sp. Boi14]|nr:hypothetical protein PBOI14_30190 [Pseudomonas sp. Boi14]
MNAPTLIKPYDIAEHLHRYTAWAASRAASTKTCRFDVSTGKTIIEATGLHLLLAGPQLLPSPENIDAQHKIWRETAIEAARNKGLVGFGHGVAAKLINVYLKGAFVCAGQELHPHVQALHPLSTSFCWMSSTIKMLAVYGQSGHKHESNAGRSSMPSSIKP